MADGGTGEKTEEPTPERLRKLRKEGNVPKSQDVTSAVGFLVVFTVIAGTMAWAYGQMQSLVHAAVYAAGMKNEAAGVMPTRILLEGLWRFSKIVGPVCAAAFVVGITMNLAQVGFLFSTKPITPDLKKLNPINGLKGLINKNQAASNKFRLITRV